jgi:hypothetical protein
MGVNVIPGADVVVGVLEKMGVIVGVAVGNAPLNSKLTVAWVVA